MRRLGALPAGVGEDDLVATVAEVLEPVLSRGARAGIAVSGGPDSVALAHLAVRARPDVAWSVVHVRHGLRDDAPDAEAAARVAVGLGVAYDERRAVVRTAGRQGVEAPAREARYEALRAAAHARGLEVVCIGHTADDRAETVLLNLGRGSGTKGLAGIPSIRRDGRLLLVRPLLRARRADVRAVASRRRLTTVHDPTNDDVSLRRTRVRQEVLPALARLSGGPGDPVAVLCRLADLAADDSAALDAEAERHAAGHLARWGPVRAVRTEVLRALPPAVARRVVRQLLASVRGGLQGLSGQDVEAVLCLRPGTAHTVSGGVLATCGRGWLAAAPRGLPPLATRRLGASGDVALPELDLRLAAASSGAPEPVGAVVPPLAAAAPRGPASARISSPATMAIRASRAGDRLRAAGGAVPVARLLVDAGVPRPARGMVPLLVDASDEVVWIPGVAAAPAATTGEIRLWLAPL